MKILLIQPPIEDFYTTKIRTFPLGLVSICSYLKSKGIKDVKVLDFLTGYKAKSIPVPPEFEYLKKYYVCHDNSPIKLFGNYYHFGASWGKIYETIEDEKPDVVGISSLFTPYNREALKCSEIVKKVSGKIKVVLGGNHPSVLPENVLKNENVDFVIRGEGEVSFYKFIKYLNGEIEIDDVENLCYKIKGGIKCNEKKVFSDFEVFNKLNLSSLALDRYKRGRKRYVFIERSRGCPFNCDFCSLRSKYGRGVREKVPGTILNEMKFLRRKYGIEIFDFTDDYLIYSKEEFKKLLKGIVNSRVLKNVELCATNGIPLEKLDFEILELMKLAGFSDINISLVSVKEESLKSMGRPSNVKMFLKVYPHIQKLNFFTTVYIILGLQGESPFDVLNSIFFLMDKNVLIGPSILYAVPGTKLYENFARNLPLHILRSSTASVLTQNFSSKSLLTLFAITRFVNFLKGKVDEDSFLKKRKLKYKKIGEFEYVFYDCREQVNELLLSLIFKTSKLWGYRVIDKKTFKVEFFEKNVFDVEILNRFFKEFNLKEISGVKKLKKYRGSAVSDFYKKN